MICSKRTSLQDLQETISQRYLDLIPSKTMMQLLLLSDADAPSLCSQGQKGTRSSMVRPLRFLGLRHTADPLGAFPGAGV